MKTVILLFVTVVAVAAASSYLTLRLATRPTANDVDSHEWLHRELQLTPAEHEALEPTEAKFAAERQELAERLRAADRDLAKAIKEDGAYTPRVAKAVETVHHRMGELQKASIEHLFQMRAFLTPEQSDKLLRLTEEALVSNP